MASQNFGKRNRWIINLLLDVLVCSICEVLEPSWLIAAGAYPGFCSMKRLEVFLLPLDGMLVHHRSLPRNFVRFPQQIAGTHLYTWVERGTVGVKCLAQEHNTLSPARARTQTARSGVEHTNHKATAQTRCLYFDLPYGLVKILHNS